MTKSTTVTEKFMYRLPMAVLISALVLSVLFSWVNGSSVDDFSGMQHGRLRGNFSQDEIEELIRRYKREQWKLGPKTTPERLSEYVDTRIGSGGYAYGVGALPPGPQVPFGACRLGPDTSLGLEPFKISFDHDGGYWYHDLFIEAFSHTHMVGSGVQALGNFGVMVTRKPVDSKLLTDSQYKSRFRHENETALPGYYSVFLEDANALAELTASGTHSGMHRYNCSGNETCSVIIDVCHTVLGSSTEKCKVASIKTTNDNHIMTSEVSILSYGEFSQRSSIGGLLVWGYFRAEAFDTKTGSPVAIQPQYWLGGEVHQGTVENVTVNGGSIGSVMSTSSSRPVTFLVRVGISFCSAEDARKNLETDQLNSQKVWISFDEGRETVQTLWDTVLSRVTVTLPSDIGNGKSSEALVKLYTAVYHSFLAPTSYSEWDGRYLGFDWKIHHWKWWNNSTQTNTKCNIGETKANARCSENLIPESSFVSDLSLWDIHRTQTPWLTLAFPERARDIVESLATMTVQSGDLPRWPFANFDTHCMIGSHGVVVMTDTLVKLCGKNLNYSCPFDKELVFKCAKNAVFQQDAQQRYDELHFVPAEESKQGASITLAQAYDDDIVGTLASYVGQQNTSIVLKKRGQYYQNVWSKSSLAFCSTYANGTKDCPAYDFIPYPLTEDYTEGNVWQWRWFVPHDVSGLIALFPNKSTYTNLLTIFFEKSFEWPLENIMPNPYYWAGNEPDLLAVWQFCWAGNEYAWLTQKYVRRLIDTHYSTSADGIPGNDDYGTMSSWLIWAMAGIYPVTGTQQYVLGSPVFRELNLSIPQSASFSGSSNQILHILSQNSSGTNIYVSKVHLNGTPLSSPFITHDKLVGSTLEFFMTDTPTIFGADAEAE